jgi:hypothetical protein
MASEFFVGDPRPVTLRGWKPKCSAEKEKRLNLEFEMQLTDEMSEVAPPQIQRMRGIVAVGENGLATAPIETEFGPLSIEVFNTPDDTRPRFTLVGATVRNVVVFRPTSPSLGAGETFMKFSVDTGTTNSEQVSWALEAMKAVCFLTFHPTTQADLPFEPPVDEKKAAVKRAKRDGKMAATGEKEDEAE